MATRSPSATPSSRSPPASRATRAACSATLRIRSPKIVTGSSGVWLSERCSAWVRYIRSALRASVISSMGDAGREPLQPQDVELAVPDLVDAFEQRVEVVVHRQLASRQLVVPSRRQAGDQL